MDIIAAHQQGLVEQLHHEVEALAGRPGDFGQRAVMLHHLFDHSRGQHVWAIEEARACLRMAERIARLRKHLIRWGWLHRDRAGLAAALDRLAEALGTQSAERAAIAYSAYRLTAAKPLQEAAQERLSRELMEALNACHIARRDGQPLPAQARDQLRLASEAAVAADPSPSLADAWAAVMASTLGRRASRLLSASSLQRARAKDARRAPDRLEATVRNDPSLPAAFRANPAQHFYAVVHLLMDRRRQQWRQLCDQEADSVALAA